MKKILSVTACFCLFAQAAMAAPPPGYKLVWSDEFNEPSLDLHKWKPETYRRDDAQLTTNAISIGQDGLRIRTWTESGINYTGFMTSRGLFMTTFGYFEARIRFHDAPGEHCAFWSEPQQLGKVIGNPGQGGVETDIIEHRITDKNGNNIGNLAAFNLHWDGYKQYHKHIGSKWLAPSSLNDSWHTYAVLWTPDHYIFYVDDAEHWHTNAAVSHIPQDVRLTCEVKGQASWSGTVPTSGYGPYTTTPYGMDVRWVRVWQKL